MKPILTILAVLIISFPVFSQKNKNKWTEIKTTNETQARSENAFARVGDKFYLLGGRGVKPVAIFNPADNSWSEGSIPPVEMHHFQAVTYNGLIYVMGGLSGKWPFEIPISHVYIYDPETDHWTVGPEMPPHRQRGAAGVTVYNDKIYIVNGIVNGHTSGWVAWFDEYDPATNTWKKLPNSPRARDHFQTAVVNDKLVVTGGRKSGFEGKGFEATIGETDIYDFNTGLWFTLPASGNIPTQRAGCTVYTHGDEIVVIGGESGSQVKAHSEVEALNVGAGSWRKLPDLATGRHGMQVVASAGTVYVAAGCGNRGGSPELNTIEKYLFDEKAPANEKTEAGVLKTDKSILDFGNVRPFSVQTEVITLSNEGGTQGIPLSYLNVTGSDNFRVSFPYVLPYVLPPGGSVELKVAYMPEDKKPSEGTLFIKKSDHGQMKPLEIKLSGGR